MDRKKIKDVFESKLAAYLGRYFKPTGRAGVADRVGADYMGDSASSRSGGRAGSDYGVGSAADQSAVAGRVGANYMGDSAPDKSVGGADSVNSAPGGRMSGIQRFLEGIRKLGFAGGDARGADNGTDKGSSIKDALLSSPEEKRAQTKRLAFGIGILLLTFVFSLAELGNTRPIGVAFMCSLDTLVPFAYSGAVIASFFAPAPVLCIATASVALVMRLLISRYLGQRVFSEALGLRVFSGALAGFLSGAINTIGEAFTLSSLLDALIFTVSIPFGTWLFSGITDKKNRFTLHYEAAVVLFLFTVCRALLDVRLMGISVCAAAVTVITLYISKSGGAFRGAVAGLLCGLAYSSVYAPGIALCGLIGGILFSRGAVFASVSGAAFAVVYGAFASGIGAFTSFAPGVLLGCGIFAPLAQYRLIPNLLNLERVSPLTEEAKGRAFGEAAIGEKRIRAEQEKLNAISDSLSSLSEVFYTLSDRLRRPGIFDVRLLCEKKYKVHCSDCALNSLCWDKEHVSSSDAITKLARRIAESGEAEVKSIPEYFRSRCPHSLRIISEINSEYARMLENSARQNRTEVFALDYEDMARLLKDASAESNAEFEVDEKLSRAARAAAKDMNFRVGNLIVFGSRKKQIICGGIDSSAIRVSSSELKNKMSKALDLELCEPQFNVDSELGTVTVSMQTKKLFEADCERASTCKKGERISGDSSASFESREGYFYSLICDGMGSGAEAALTSRITGIFLAKMLGAGNRKSVVLQMLNNFIRNKNLECFSTVDLLEIDLFNGNAGFVKSGAAPSYILRGGKLFRIASSSLPIGITREINAEEINFLMEDGDIVVMISDGAAQGFEDSIWLAELLVSDELPSDLKKLAELILDAAVKRSGRKDDISVSVVRVKKPNDKQ